MKILILALVLSGCSQLPKFGDKIDFLAQNHESPLRVIKREFYEVKDAENILRNTPEGAISIWIRQTGEQDNQQDVISISTGSTQVSRRTSRAAIKIFPGGRLFAAARASDLEQEQNIMTGPILEKGKWQHVFLNINYAKDDMKFYVDGVQVRSRGIVRFKAKKTSDTPSHSVVLGAEEDGGAGYFSGQVKDIAVWKKTLSEENIRAVWKKIKPDEKIMIGF